MLLFTVVVSLVAGVVAGLGPALQGSRMRITEDLGTAGRGGVGGRSR